MAVTITDTRTLVDHADAVGTWTSPVAGETLNLFTTDPNPVEPTGSLGMAVSTQTSDILFPISAVDLSDVLIYVWVLANGTMDTEANGGIAMVLLDATPDEIGYHLAGSDIAAFRHSDGPVGWQCLLLDTAIKIVTPGNFTNLAGLEANLDFTNITGIGAMYKTLSKALGGASNCFTDTIRYGNNGIIIGGGTTGARGTFAEMAADDRSETNAKAWGIIRELGAGVFGVQGPLTFGHTGATAAHWFQDTNVVVAFEDRNIGTARYFFDVVANTTDVGHFQLGLISGTEGGSDGCTIIIPAGIGGDIDMSDPDMDFIGLYASVFNGFDGGVLFSDDATNGITHDVFACDFILCGTINPGRVDMKNCAIINSAAASAMLLEDSDNTLIASLDFQSDGTGHAIELTHVGAGPHAITLKGHKYTGYATIDGSTGDEVVLYNPGTLSADITITVSESGDTPTIMKAAGVTGTVTVVNNKTVTFTGMRDNSEVRVYRASDGVEIAGIENVSVGPPDDKSFAWTAAAGLTVDYVIHNWLAGVPVYETIRVNDFDVPNDDTSIGIQQRLDRNAV